MRIISWPSRLTLIVFLILAGCGPATPARAPITFMVFGDPAELKAYQTLVAQFKTQRSDIAITLNHIPSASDYRLRLNADLAAGTPADVVLINYRRLAGYAAQNQLTPLTDYLAHSAQLRAEDFYPQAYDAFNWDGQQWCIPQNISSLVVYYNRDLFTAAGVPEPSATWTLADFVGTAQQLTQDHDGDGGIDQYGLGTEVTFIRLAPFIWQKPGAELLTQSPLRLALNSLPAFQAFQWFVDLRLAHGVVPTAIEEASENSESRFFNGRTAMYLDSRRLVPALRETAIFDWDVAPLPNGQQPANILHADGFCIPAAAQDPAAAWAFVEFANSPAGQEIIAATGRTVPSNRAVAESPIFLNPAVKPAHSQVWLDALPNLRALPAVPHWADIEEIVDEEIQRAFYGQASVADATLAAINRAEEYLLLPLP